jgi:hypothetical protein
MHQHQIYHQHNLTTTIDELGAAWDLLGLPTSLPILETASGGTK